MKTIEDCRHQIETKCSSIPTRKDCKESCIRTLQCSHKCSGKCSDVCNSASCRELVPVPAKSLCGHRLMISCSEYQKSMKF